MYIYLLFFHSLFRWLVLAGLVYAVYKGFKGWMQKGTFTKTDDTVRHVTATISHIQLTIGYVLYFNSPVIAYFRSDYSEASKHFEFMFFGMIHILLMTIAVFVISIGSSVTKRLATNEEKFRTMAIWYAVALLIIFCAIPWPFSPLANRPYIRPF
ncbi:hypothetical protein DYBT9275_03078 [Dyadobacter sp. CECT 9275]|uniref:Cytochrome B n=1 Tax=Dyadobacter helix TaxID=2822344 RepID=A0A916JDT7_9BACT|nr:hypothetical protein [Dyadobacter sp. CECT 9275]CAG5003161.1 hypothetical protein DYBT9275_03078 [Dyadobacter sp. CECT 9275]